MTVLSLWVSTVPFDASHTLEKDLLLLKAAKSFFCAVSPYRFLQKVIHHKKIIFF